MRRSHQSRTSQRQRETRSQSPCARRIFRPLRRSKTGTPTPDAPKPTPTTIGSTKTSSCDDTKPLHFFVEPDAVNDQRNCGRERRDCASKINRCAFNEIDPNAPSAGPDRKQRRENDENNTQSRKRHLPKERVVVPRQEYKPEEAEHRKAWGNQDAVDQPCFRRQVQQ